MLESELDRLNQEFGIEQHLQFVKSHGELISTQLNNSFGEAEIVLQGGQLIHWQPSGQTPVIWLSQASDFKLGKAIRGGIPVCWPWFGRHEQHSDYPAHGFARTHLWDVVKTKRLKNGEIIVRLSLAMAKEGSSFWPYTTQLDIEFTLGEQLSVELTTTNLCDNPVEVGEALHSYFAVSDIHNATVIGLDGVHYIDKLAAGDRFKQQGEIYIDQEMDRVFINANNQCVISDPGLERRILLNKSNSLSTVVWNPWEQKSCTMGDMNDDSYLGMLCVETANVLENKVTINAGQQHSLKFVCGIETYES